MAGNLARFAGGRLSRLRMLPSQQDETKGSVRTPGWQSCEARWVRLWSKPRFEWMRLAEISGCLLHDAHQDLSIYLADAMPVAQTLSQSLLHHPFS